MSNKCVIVPIQVSLDKRLSKNEIRVLIAVISLVNDGVRINREQISERCGLSVSKVSTATSSLVKLGWLIKSGSESLYTVIVPRL